MDYSRPGFPVLHHLLEFAQTQVHWVSDAIQTSRSLSSPLLLPSIFPSVRVFSNELALCIRWQNSWRFSLSINPSREYSGLISFRIGWFNLLEVQGIFKSLLQYHSLEASILPCSAFLMVKCSHPYMTTGKTIALTRETTRLFWNTAAPVSSPISSPRALALFHMLANTWHCEFFFPFSFLSSWWTCSNISV